MPVPSSLAIAGLIYWNSYTFSFHHDSPIPITWQQIFRTPSKLPNSGIRLQGQTVLITGANSGLGLETARKCIQFGAERIIFGVRNLEKGEAAKKELSTGATDKNVTTQIDVWHLDLEDFQSIVEFAKKLNEDFKGKGRRLDYAILNAGTWHYRYYRATTGYEMCLQVNTLGNALLSLLLLPTLSRSSSSSNSPARLAFSTSETYAWSDLKSGVHPDLFTHQSDPDRYKGCNGYHLSKLLLMFWSRELSSRVDPSKVIVGDTTPGLCETPIFGAPARNAWIGNCMMKLASHSAEDGAIMYMLSVFCSKNEEFHDGYFTWGMPSKRSKYVRSKEGARAQKEVWNQMMTIFRTSVPDLDISGISGLKMDDAAVVSAIKS